jgi:alpha-D-xyloside xylohydrolase
MMGEFLLVAPLFANQTGREIVLPKGDWFDFYTGDYMGNGEVIYIEQSLGRIPLFVKDGGIIPTIPAIRQTADWADNMALEVRVYGNKDYSFDLYDDDGKTFDYKLGKYSIKRLNVEGKEGKVEDVYGGDPWTYARVSWRFMTD